MEDEVFEDFLERIDMVYKYQYDIRKTQMKRILEEIESNAYEKAIKDFNDLADGKIIMKEAKP